MSILIPVIYNKKLYPKGINPKIEEIAGHFDKISIKPKLDYSLHTEYSIAKRNLNSNLLVDLPLIQNSHKNFIPQLWTSAGWARAFSTFIKRLVGPNIPPKIIEIHPPFNDYCATLETFLETYAIFEDDIRKEFPQTEIVLENRYGTMYSGGKFLLSTRENMIQFCEMLRNAQVKLKIVLDIPQLFTAHKVKPDNLTENIITEILTPLQICKDLIAGIHIWGKKLNDNGRLLSHQGDLNTYCNNKPNLKNALMSTIYNLLNDGKPRYFVPEVNSKIEDLISIVNDFINAGFEFIS